MLSVFPELPSCASLVKADKRAALHQTELAVSCVDAIVLSMLVLLGTLQDAELQNLIRQGSSASNCVKYLVWLRLPCSLMPLDGSAARGLYCMCFQCDPGVRTDDEIASCWVVV